jgi:hypothetical protein
MKTRETVNPRSYPSVTRYCLLLTLVLCVTCAFTLRAAAAPHIGSLSPKKGPVGTVVTITGAGFGVSQGTGFVTFNGSPALTPCSWSDTQIVVTVPGDATTGPVVVSAGGVLSNGAKFTVTIVVTSVFPTCGSVGTAVTITGSGFGSSQGKSTVTFKRVLAPPTYWSATTPEW